MGKNKEERERERGRLREGHREKGREREQTNSCFITYMNTRHANVARHRGPSRLQTSDSLLVCSAQAATFDASMHPGSMSSEPESETLLLPTPTLTKQKQKRDQLASNI